MVFWLLKRAFVLSYGILVLWGVSLLSGAVRLVVCGGTQGAEKGGILQARGYSMVSMLYDAFGSNVFLNF